MAERFHLLAGPERLGRFINLDYGVLSVEADHFTDQAQLSDAYLCAVQDAGQMNSDDLL